ncbi:MAG: GUN4 domain-containing protein, partial [Dolichospermum sp.]
DNLWLTYSNHKFGFSVQLSVYKELVATGRYNSNMKLLTAFDSRLDWDRGGVLRFVEGYPDGILYNISARKGHLPYSAWKKILTQKIFLSRLEACNL